MGVVVHGMDDWLDDLETLPERAQKAFPPVMGRAGMQMKLDWKARWTAMPHEHIPHLLRAIGYDTSDRNFVFRVDVGIASGRLQSRLASFIEYGTQTSGPHPAGQPALEKEAPLMAAAAERVAADLLEGKA